LEKVKLTQIPNRPHLTGPAQYWVDSDGHILISCPYCGRVSVCYHKVLCVNPLTLTPSVIEHPCEHHFNVKDGYAS